MFIEISPSTLGAHALFRRSHVHDGLMVERTQVVEDGDTLEFDT